MEMMDTSDSERTAECDRLIFCNTVPELVKLATFRLTLDLWSDCLQDPSDSFECTLKRRIDNLLDELAGKISDSTKNTITWYSRRMRKCTSIWVAYHKERVFKYSDLELITGMCLPELIWRSDGSIDGAKSAEALVKSAMLGDEQEYKLVCLYCMEKKIANMWRRLADDQCIILDANFNEEVSLMSYWNSRMAGFFCASGVKSMENRMFSNDVIDNLSAALYFFNRLPEAERVEKGCQLISAVKFDERAEYVKVMLTKFNEDELRRAFQLHCSDIMYPLMVNRMYTRYALQVWDRVKDSLTIHAFLNIMTRITAAIRAAYKNPVGRFDHELDDYDDFKRHIFASVADLWQMTPDILKKHDLMSALRGVIYTLVEYYVKMNNNSDPVRGFLSTLMSDAGDKLRHRVMSRLISQLALACRPRDVSDIFDVCYSRDRDKDYFKSVVMQARTVNHHLVNLFRAKKFAELEEFLEVYVSEPSKIRLKKKSILEEVNDPRDLFSYPYELNDSEVESMRRFVADAFDNDTKSANKFKRKMYSYYPRLWPERFESEVDDVVPAPSTR